jgi:hypothetical protein
MSSTDDQGTPPVPDLVTAPLDPVTDPVLAPVPVEVAPRPKFGDVVTFNHFDVVSGSVLTGPGVVVEAGTAGSVCVAPLSGYLIDVQPDQLVTLERL